MSCYNKHVLINYFLDMDVYFMKKFILFDVDGTLLNTEKMYMKSLQLVLENEGIKASYDDVYHTFGLPAKDALEFFNVENIDAVALNWQNHHKDFWSDVDLFPGIKELLFKLKQNNCTLGIVTSNSKEQFEHNIKDFDIQKYFDNFVFAGQTRHMKPFADPILLSLENLNAAADNTIYIGDSVHDMSCAHNAGIDFGLASWGVSSLDPFYDKQEYIFKHPKDILNLI